MFTKVELRRLIVPLVLEQLLAVAVGMADTIMISSVGEAAVSSISLVDNINVLLINIFAALATGGAVVIGYRLGGNDQDGTNQVAEQLYLVTIVLSVVIMGCLLLGRGFILTVVFGDIAADVMSNAQTYLIITSFAVPFIAIYNAGAAVFRSTGNSKLPMKLSFLMNGINVIGNAILIYGFRCGVEGAAIPTLVSRIVVAVIITTLLCNPKLTVYLGSIKSWRIDLGVIRRICSIGIPTGVENGLFQLGKIMVLSMVASFGTASITANAVAGNIAMFQIMPGMAIGIATITVISRCMGAGNIEEVKYYKKLLMKYTHAGMIGMNLLVMIALPFILRIYHLSEETASMTREVVIYYGIFCMIVWPTSFLVPNVLRATGDAVYPMVISMLSMWICRIGFSYLLGVVWNMGLFGIWVSMTLDWVARAICFTVRYKRGKWERNALVR
ncbi:MAG: MATE family efflux transporter [Eubacteriales bacterium]